MNLPFEIPPFDPGKFAPKPRFDWWGWNPAYPYWSRSCWGSEDEHSARELGEKHFEFSVYAAAFVKQDGKEFTVLEMRPPLDGDAWTRAAGIEKSQAF